MPFTLKMGPMFSLVKSETGAITTDPTTYDLDNYPLERLLVSMGDKVQFYWEGAGSIPADDITFKVIVYDATNLRYVPIETVSALNADTLTEIDTKGYPFYLSVSAVNISVAVNLKVWAAFMLDAPRRGM